MINSLVFKFNDFVENSSKISIDKSYLEEHYYDKTTIDTALDGIDQTISSNASSLLDELSQLVDTLDNKQDKGDYVTNSSLVENYVNKKDYKESDLSHYVLDSSVSTNYAKKTELNAYATNTYVNSTFQPKGNYLTEHQSLTGLATKDELKNYQPKGTYLTSIPSEYITETELNSYGFLTEHQSLEGLVTKDELSDFATESDLQKVEAIAKGKNRAHVFDTKEELDSWLEDEDNIATLQKGDNIYIKEVDTPDYWWTGEAISELETQKVNLTEYAKTTDIPTDYLSTTTTDLQTVASTVKFKNVSIGDKTSAEFNSYYVERLSAGDSDTPNYLTLNVGNAGYATIQHMRGEDKVVDAYLLLDANGLKLRYSGTKGVAAPGTNYTVLDSKNYINYFTDAEVDKSLGKIYVTNSSVYNNYAKKTELDNYATKESIADLQLFKFPNATIYGQPTINNGQISGFSETNYMQFPFIVNFQNRPFEIKMCFTTSNNVTTQENIFDSAYGLAFAIRNRHFIAAISQNGSTWSMELQGTYTVLPNTTYYIKLVWDGQSYYLRYSLDDSVYEIDFSGEINYTPYPKQIIIGKSLDNRYVFRGNINFNYCSLTISEKLVWQGMDDVGLATRLAVDLANIDQAGEQKIKDIIGPIPEPQEPQDLTNYATKTYVDNKLDYLIWEGTQEQYDQLSDKSLYKIYTIIE